LTASDGIINDDFERNTETIYDPTAVIIRNMCCSWSSTSTLEPSITLRDISLLLPEGVLIAIIGEVTFKIIWLSSS
jgi:ATP-binding cassette subfamily C (CFTR/MRP) protein 10